MNDHSNIGIAPRTMPITAEEARLRAAGRAALPQVRPLGASRHDGSGDFLTSMFGSLSTNISTVASAVDPWVGESFALQGHGAQAATPIRSAAPSTPAAGFEVPEVPAPPAFVEDREERGHECPYARPFSQEHQDIQGKRERKSRHASRGRRSSVFVAIEQLDSVLEEAPLIAVLDVPSLHGLQSERLRPSLCVPLPPQNFVIEDLQSDSRRYVFEPESRLAGAWYVGQYIHSCVESTTESPGYTGSSANRR